jgi:hypothetical protein
MKGGKVLGQGGYGCVIQPAIMCKNNDDPKNKVSKIIRMDELSQEERDELDEEFHLSQKFKKIDKKHEYFLGGIDKCTFKSSKVPTKDLKNCKFPTNKEIDIMNIIMTIGEDFGKIAKKLKTPDLLKAISHLLIGARKSLIDLDIVLLDIKSDNILFVKDKKNKELIHPVFIDFSPGLIIQSKDDFYEFLASFGIAYYFVWPLEILLSMYVKDGRKKRKLPKIPKESDSDKVKDKYDEIEMENVMLENDQEDFRENLNKYHNYDMDKQSYRKHVKSFYKDLRKDYKNTMSKVLVYQIAKSFESLNDSKLNDIVKDMIHPDYKKRLNIDDALKVIKAEIGSITNNKLLIEYKKVTKLKKLKKLFSKFFIKKKFKNKFKKKNKKKNKKNTPKNN